MKYSDVLLRIGDLLSTYFKIPYERREPISDVAIGEYKFYLFPNRQSSTVETIMRTQDAYDLNVVLATRFLDETGYISFLDKTDEVRDYFKEELPHPYYFHLLCEGATYVDFLCNGAEITYSIDTVEEGVHYATFRMTISNGDIIT